MQPPHFSSPPPLPLWLLWRDFRAWAFGVMRRPNLGFWYHLDGLAAIIEAYRRRCAKRRRWKWRQRFLRRLRKP